MKKNETHQSRMIKTSAVAALLRTRVTGLASKALPIILTDYEPERAYNIVRLISDADPNEVKYIPDILLGAYESFEDESYQLAMLDRILEDKRIAPRWKFIQFSAAMICTEIMPNRTLSQEQIHRFARLFILSGDLSMRQMSEYSGQNITDIIQRFSKLSEHVFRIGRDCPVIKVIRQVGGLVDCSKADYLKEDDNERGALKHLLSELAHKKTSSLSSLERLVLIGQSSSEVTKKK